MHSVRLRVLLDATRVLSVSGGEVECEGCRISVAAPGHVGGVEVNPSDHAVGHGQLRAALAIEGHWTVDLPARLTTTIELKPAT